jgi:Domain of Unknown Function (DUF350)
MAPCYPAGGLSLPGDRSEDARKILYGRETAENVLGRAAISARVRAAVPRSALIGWGAQSKGDMSMEIFIEYLKLIGWGVVGILTMVLSLWILLLVFTWLTPVDEWEELKKGNLAIAIVMAAVIIGFALVISSAIAPVNFVQ